MSFHVDDYQALRSRYSSIPYRRCGSSGLDLPAVSLGLWHNFGDDVPLERTAIVYKNPLPYLYAAAEIFRGAGIPYQMSDALPLAAEPTSAALDLILDTVSSRFSRSESANRSSVSCRNAARRSASHSGSCDGKSSSSRSLSHWPTKFATKR